VILQFLSFPLKFILYMVSVTSRSDLVNPFASSSASAMAHSPVHSAASSSSSVDDDRPLLDGSFYRSMAGAL
jgi:hypothetical protein